MKKLGAFLADVGIDLVLCEIEAESRTVVKTVAQDSLDAQISQLEQEAADFSGLEKPSMFTRRLDTYLCLAADWERLKRIELLEEWKRKKHGVNDARKEMTFTEFAEEFMTKLKPKTINNQLAVLSRMLNCAEEWEYIEAAPKVKLLKSPKPEMNFLEFDEAERLVQAAERGLERMLILTALKTGLRIGELLALRWDDVDFERQQIHVRRSYIRGHVDTPKSGHDRVVPMSAEIFSALHSYRHICGPLVFCNPDGSYLTDNQTKHYLYRACRKAFLNTFGWHVC